MDTVKLDYKMRGAREIVNFNFEVKDSSKFNILGVMDEVIELIEESLKKGNVLVHCRHGVSRSSSFIIGYLIKKKKLR